MVVSKPYGLFSSLHFQKAAHRPLNSCIARHTCMLTLSNQELLPCFAYVMPADPQILIRHLEDSWSIWQDVGVMPPLGALWLCWRCNYIADCYDRCEFESR
jgi:hypothetical protein